MGRHAWAAVVAGMVAWSVSLPAAAGEAAPEPVPSIEHKTEGLRRIPGLFPLYWDAAAGRLWMQLDRFGDDLLYYTSLAGGLGSNDVGLDRGQLGRGRLVRFVRSGPRVLLVEPNLAFRADSDSPDERRAVDEAFARSVVWGFEVAAETDGRVLVDATPFVVRDAHGLAAALRRTEQGDHTLDAARSAVSLEHTRSFPRNTELEAVVTLTTSGDPGDWVASVTPDPGAVTLVQRQSLVALPDTPWKPRRAVPGAGFGTVEYLDYAAPLGEPLRQLLVTRHRLEAGGHIVYYVDRGAPEPVRSALLDGARWWAEAFDAAGFPGAFRVELLPEGADPLDARYNVIQWVHRSTRGWSYGTSLVDPRSGEILKGHVSLGSLRVRQDYLIAEGLLSPYQEGDERSEAAERLALARIRQLAAHEVGHTLGLAHNYVASAEGRASVMDYPHPLVKLAPDGGLDVSEAYAVGVGAWDRVAIAYGYTAFSEGTHEDAALDALLREARDRGVTFLTDQDARPPGGAHPRAHLWDNGADAVAELERVLEVRRAALDRLGERSIRAGRPLATIEEALVPVYLFHRYQLEAAVKLVAGVDYAYPMRGDAEPPAAPVPAAAQRRALDAVLATLEPATLALPPRLARGIPPRPYLYPAHRELFPRHTGPVFDAVTPAVVAADLTLALVLQPERAARLVEQHALDPALPGLAELLDAVIARASGPPPAEPYQSEVARAVGRVVAERLMRLAGEAPMAQVRAEAESALERLSSRLQGAPSTGAEAAHRRLLVRDLERFLERPAGPAGVVALPEAPPGSPIGTTDPAWLETVAGPACGR